MKKKRIPADRRRLPYLGQIGERVKSTAGEKDLILPESGLKLLQDVVGAIKAKSAVSWFAPTPVASRGLALLLAGSGATAKITMAKVLANELNLTLYRINLTRVVSQYIGETEKNLNRLFDEAESSSVILFFDEADALFGKRSEVKNAHDRYANIEINYLLKCLGTHSGLVILSVNRRDDIDEAFLSSFHSIIECPGPNPSD